MYKQNGDKKECGVRYLHNKEGASMYKRRGDNAGRSPHVAKKQKSRKRLRPLLFRLASEASSDDESVHHADTKQRDHYRPHIKGYGTQGTASAVSSPTYAQGGFHAGKKDDWLGYSLCSGKKRGTCECKIQKTRKLTQQNLTACNTSSPLTREDHNTRQQTSLCSLKQ